MYSATIFSGAFLFFIFKKIKFQKYISVLENFKNILRSPYGGRQGSNVIFFFKFATKSLEKKKEGSLLPPPNGRQAPVAHPRGDRPMSPVGGATGSLPPILTTGQHSPPFPLSFEPKNSETKERGEEKKSGEALPNCVLLIYR